MLKDYDMSVLFHPDKASVVTDALIRLSMNNVAQIEEHEKELVCEVHRLACLGVRLVHSVDVGVII